MKFSAPALALSLLMPATLSQAEDPSSAKAAPPAPTRGDVPYGEHELTVLDFWQAEGDGPRPLHVHIHGGGWTSGDKEIAHKDAQRFLDRGISFASVNYRLTPEHPLPAPVHDAARAIQFLRSKAGEWNLRKERITLSGSSAGACTSMWLLCHDDLAEPDSEDPVARESTRVLGAAAKRGQTSIDPKVIEPWLGPGVLEHRMINMAMGEETMAGALENYDEYAKRYREFSPVNYVSAEDPPLWMEYGGDMTLPSKNAGHGIHHPVYGVKMKERCDEAGMECHLVIPGVSRSGKYPTAESFLFGILLAD